MVRVIQIYLSDIFKTKRNQNNYHERQNRVTSACKLHNLIFFVCKCSDLNCSVYRLTCVRGNQQFQLDGQAGKKSG